jgi:hypothetical protein
VGKPYLRIKQENRDTAMTRATRTSKDVRHLKGLIPKPRKPVSVADMKAAVRKVHGRK